MALSCSSSSDSTTSVDKIVGGWRLLSQTEKDEDGVITPTSLSTCELSERINFLAGGNASQNYYYSDGAGGCIAAPTTSAKWTNIDNGEYLIQDLSSGESDFVMKAVFTGNKVEIATQDGPITIYKTYIKG